LSKIIRHSKEAPPIYIGERHLETTLEKEAEDTLHRIFPVVSFLTAPDGVKLVPIQEVHKFKAVMDEECVKARKTGYEEGYHKGLEEGREDARKVLRQFEGAINDVVNQRESLLSETKQKILELTIQIAQKTTFDAINVDREATVTMIERVIGQLADRSRLKIRVNPDFLPIVEQQIDRLLGSSTSIKELTFEGDPRVRSGGCFIETPTGDIDARLESQFDVIRETMFSGEDDQ